MLYSLEYVKGIDNLWKQIRTSHIYILSLNANPKNLYVHRIRVKRTLYSVLKSTHMHEYKYLPKWKRLIF